MQIEILNKAKCVNDYFSVAKVEHDEHYQLSFLAFAFDGKDAFDVVSSIHTAHRTFRTGWYKNLKSVFDKKYLKNCDILVCVKTDEAHCGPVESTCDTGYSALVTPSE